MAPIADDEPSPLEPPAGSAVVPWRELLARRLTWLVLVLDVLGSIASVALVHGPGRLPIGACGALAGLALAGALRPGVSHRARAWILVVSLGVVGIAGFATLGFLAGPTSALLMCALTAGLLLGPRAMGAVLGAQLVALAAVAAAVTGGHLPTPLPIDVTAHEPRVWLRTLGVTFLLFVAMGAMVTWVVAQAEASSAGLREEAARRRDAEVARRRAERLALESQKLELVGRLSAGVAHDVNNFLAVVAMSNARLAREDLSPEERARASRAIGESVDRASALARQLMVLGRTAPRAPRVLFVDHVVRELSPALERILPADLSLSLSLEPAVAFVDAMHVEQVLLNLVLNARDATPSGGRVSVRCGPRALAAPRAGVRGEVPPGDYAVLEVEDDGAGIDAATLPRIFEPFFTTKSLDRGSGLGLSTVATIAEESGGHVVLESAVGKGTTVGLWLPARPPPAPEPRREARAPRAVSLEGRVILVAEDEPALLADVVRVLEEAGAVVKAARDGTEALALLREADGPIDLLCTDVVMPGAAARELIDAFEARFPGRPVLASSGYVGEELVRRGIEEGRYHLLSKPFGPTDLLLAVGRLLEGGAGAAERDATGAG